MKNKFNWGWKIALLYGGFVVLMILMVIRASSEKVELVTKDYYEEELRYQQRIDHTRMADSLHLQPSWTIEKSKVSVRFSGHDHEALSGTITFYCPSDEHRDFKYPFTTVADSLMVIEHAGLHSGTYRINTEWQQRGQSLHSESVIKID